MDLGLTRLTPRGRDVDHRAAAVAGLAAGAVLMVIELIAAAWAGGGEPWRVPQLVAALSMGGEAMQAPAGAFDVTVIAAALVTHYALGIAFGLLLGEVLGLLPRAHAAITDAGLGALFGLLLYVLNFHVLTGALSWFAELRGAGTVAAHLVFGIVAALLYRRLRRPPD